MNESIQIKPMVYISVHAWCCAVPPYLFVFFFFFFFFFSFFFLGGGGGGLGGDSVGVSGAGLHHIHSREGSEPRLEPTPQFTVTPDP